MYATVFVIDDIEPVYIDISQCSIPADAYKTVLAWFGQDDANIANIILPDMQNICK